MGYKLTQVALGLDIGTKRIGVSWGDSAVKIATPYGVVAMDDNTIIEIKKLIEKFKATVLVIGLPRNAAGEETKQSKFVRDFAQRLEPLGPSIVFQDESLTSVEAEQLLSKIHRSNSYNKDQIDAIAASIILSDYLEDNFG
jgi:putative Holliday junction resolvase